MTTTFLPERSQQQQLINPFVHASGYRFANVPVEKIQTHREHLLETAKSLSLKGSLLLGKEGLNMYVSGRDEAIRAFQEHLNTYPYFKDFSLKWSYSREQPYNRMLVRIKNEIVTMGCGSICPAGDATAPYITPKELKAKLDAGDDIVLVDTRNDYEVALGTFDKAVAFDIASFREFPETVLSKKEEWAGKTIVTFCTGGIRCEKAAPYLLEQGFEDVYQLEGGILKYFEHCGGAHYHGECFVFDKRVAVDTNLAETDTIQCFACRMPLTKDMQKDTIAEMTCPHCGGSPAHGKYTQKEAA